MLLAAIALAFAACNPSEKPADTAAAPVDSTAVQPEPAPTAPAYNAALDCIKIDPAHHKAVADSLGIRMVEITFKPGESSPLHAHPDFAMYAIEGGTMELTAQDGTKSIRELKAGTTMVNGATEHTPKNIGKTPVRMMVFEVNRPRPVDGAAAEYNTALDAVKVDPAHYKVLKDTLGIRVLEINYKAGEASVMHAHPDQALYVIQGSKAEMTAKDGTKTMMDLKAGMTSVGGGGEHLPKNAGKTAMKAILVEVNRPRN